MKRILAAALLVATLAGAAFAAVPITDAIIVKILAVKAKEFINAGLIAKIMESNHYDFRDSAGDFSSAYYSCRSGTYKALFNSEGSESSDSTAWNRYIQLRTITVAVFKEQLHEGNTLVDTYNGCRKDLIEVAKGQSVEFRTNLLSMINLAISDFENVESDASRTELVRAVSNDPRYAEEEDDKKVAAYEEMLGQNRPAVEIAEKIQADQSASPDTTTPSLTIITKDVDMGKFALRRWNEGGKSLTDKYLAVLKLVREDIAGTIQK